MIFGLVFFSALIGYGIGSWIGVSSERNRWIEQIKEEESKRHVTQGNAFWQK
jgi:hypothetical protein